MAIFNVEIEKTPDQKFPHFLKIGTIIVNYLPSINCKKQTRLLVSRWNTERSNYVLNSME